MGRPRSLPETLPGLWTVFRRFGPHLRGKRLLVAGSTGALLLEVGFRLLEPWPIKLVFDYVIAPVGPVPPGLPGPALLLAASALAVLVLSGLRALAAYASTVGFTLAGNQVVAEVRRDVYHHLLRLSLSFHHRARNGDLVVRIIGDVGVLRDAIVTAALPLLTNVLVMLGIACTMFWLNWRLAALSLVALPLFALTTRVLGRRIQGVARDQRRREGALAATAGESLVAIRAVQACALEPRFERAFGTANGRSLRDGARAKRLEARLERTVDVLVAAAVAGVIYYGALLVLAQQLTPGDLLVFLAYQKSAFKPMRDFAKYTGRLAKASASGERVLRLLDQSTEIRDRPGARTAPPFHGHVRFEQVRFGYDDGPEVLDFLSFELRPGERVALLGPSGAGKSTIAGLMLRLFDPREGRVTIDGHDIREYSIASLRSRIGVVLQEHPLFAGTIRENLAHTAPDATPQEVEAAARLVGAHDFISALPEGYDTPLGERGLTLSRGQRQRLALAQATLRDTAVLLLDEPTTGLDADAARVVEAGMERLARGRTTLLITHDLQLASRADRVLVLREGQIMELGPSSPIGGEPTELDRSMAGVPFAPSAPAEPEDTDAFTG